MSEPSTSDIADALEACDWTKTPIGNKAIIQAAITALRAIANSDEFKIAYQEGHFQGYYDAMEATQEPVPAPKVEHCINCGMAVDPKCACLRGREAAARAYPQPSQNAANSDCS